jgi:hypothetical protein
LESQSLKATNSTAWTYCNRSLSALSRTMRIFPNISE